MIRLDKFLSEASPYSRRDVRGLVKRGAVSVNGVSAKAPDMKVNENQDVICVNGEHIIYRKFIYLMMNKPQGYLSATEDDRDPVVIDLLPEEYRHFSPFPVGRLDKDTEGLLLLTNDGQFDHELMSPRKNLFKRYYAELDKPAVEEDITSFASGMEFKEFTAKPARLEIDPDDPRKVFVEIAEGKYHQVKRMCERVGKTVIFLKRVAIGPLQLDGTLAAGQVRELTQEEYALLMSK
ncbi:MAG: rRNA pseudouridine synthase [Lentisphaerae bacterium]|nr:rRNA pseudouridine synthase [Lentisphaerota bacterium]